MAPSTITASILHRPYSVYPQTNMMNPDGFFITNLGIQFIEVQIVNNGNITLKNMRVYIEGFSDPDISPYLELQAVGDVPAGASVPLRFQADFGAATPGKTLVSFIIESDGFEFKRIIKTIFVTQLKFHRPTKTIQILAPEGRMKVNINKAILGPRCKRRSTKDTGGELSLFLPTQITYEWVPNPSYAGKYAPLPYEDPYWKALVFVVVFIVALIIALLYDYFSDGTLDGGSVSVSGGDIPQDPDATTFYDTNDPSQEYCCDDIESKIPTKSDNISAGASGYGDWIEKGLYAAVGPVAAGVAALADFEDPHYRGQKNTTPLPFEFTVSEKVVAKIKYPMAPSLGKNYSVKVRWKYERITSGQTYDYEMVEEQENIHFLKSYKVEAPDLHDRRRGPLKIRAQFQKPSGKYYRGGELYVFGVLVSTYGAVRKFALMDHGMELDDKPNDSWYTGGYTFDIRKIQGGDGPPRVSDDLPGDWYIFIFAQDINTVLDGTNPLSAAKTIGGIVLTPQMKLSFDGPCTLDHDAIVHVV